MPRRRRAGARPSAARRRDPRHRPGACSRRASTCWAPSEKRALQAAGGGRAGLLALAGRVLQRRGDGNVARRPPAARGAGPRAAALGSTLEGEREYIFKHVLTRDVAYASLPRRERARAHGTSPAWIESAAGGRQREFADLLGTPPRIRVRGLVADSATPPDRREELRRRSLQRRWPPRRRRGTGCCSRSERFGEAALGLAADAHERSLALEALGLCGSGTIVATTPSATSPLPSTSASSRAERSANRWRCCAHVPSSHRRAGPLDGGQPGPGDRGPLRRDRPRARGTEGRGARAPAHRPRHVGVRVPARRVTEGDAEAARKAGEEHSPRGDARTGRISRARPSTASGASSSSWACTGERGR